MTDRKESKTVSAVKTFFRRSKSVVKGLNVRTARAESGFTVIEMIVVVAIITILSSIAAITATGSIDRMKADMTARTVALSLNRARIRAISENNDYIVTFVIQDPGTTGKSGYLIQIHDDDNRNGTRDTGEKVEVEELTKGVPFDLKSGKDLYCTSSPPSTMLDGIVFPDNKVTFYPRGNASDSGEVYIFPLTSKEKGRKWNRRAISLEKVSGKPILWRFDRSKDEGGQCPWVKY